jgi:hypothetical protein
MATEELIILQKTYDMINYGYQAISQFPKVKICSWNRYEKMYASNFGYTIVAHKKFIKKLHFKNWMLT